MVTAHALFLEHLAQDQPGRGANSRRYTSPRRRPPSCGRPGRCSHLLTRACRPFFSPRSCRPRSATSWSPRPGPSHRPGFVVEDGDLLALEVLGDVLAGHPGPAGHPGRRRGRCSSRPRSVYFGLVLAGLICSTPFPRLRPCCRRDGLPRAVMAGDHRHLAAGHLVGDRDRLACGSQASSPICSDNCWPSTPPAALKSATACCAPVFIWSPAAALGCR